MSPPTGASLSGKRNESPTESKKDMEKKAKLQETDAKKTPYRIYMDAREEWINRRSEIIGCLLIKGIEKEKKYDEEYDEEEDSEDDNEETEEDYSKYTSDQMNSLRWIMITKNREKQHDAMRKLILGDQAEESFLMFNTSFSYEVLHSWGTLKKRLPRKSPSQKLDTLIGYTLNLNDHDVWMHDNEGNMGELVQGLAKAWKNLLKKNSDEQLGWDVEYTKPGVLEFLAQFKKKIENMEEYYEMGEFVYGRTGAFQEPIIK